MHLVQWVVTSQARTEKWTQSNRAKPRNGEKWDQTLHEVAFNSYLFCKIMKTRNQDLRSCSIIRDMAISSSMTNKNIDKIILHIYLKFLNLFLYINLNIIA